MKKKIIALLMAAAVTTGVGGYGTYAYFTDSDNLTDKVNITIGTLDVDAYWATGEGKTTWVATNPATEAVALDKGQTLSFENLKAGDTFERDVVIANYGTLKGDITVAPNSDLGGITVELVNVTSQTGKVAADPAVPGRYYENGVGAEGGFIRATVRVTVPADAGNDWMGTGAFNEAHNFVVVGAHQTIY